MQARVLSICDKLPAWVKTGFDEYSVRLRQKLPLTAIDLPLAPRTKQPDLRRVLADEGARMQAAVPKSARVIALDQSGECWSSEALARNLEAWMQDGRELCFLIGGPDGLAPSCLQAAHARFSLGALTLPHALVRIILAEQLFRAISMLNNHPYHRAARPG
jgi:23S rRNA (pseudouridine1915-N3)-methyltransferase